jgi:glycosidase
MGKGVMMADEMKRGRIGQRSGHSMWPVAIVAGLALAMSCGGNEDPADNADNGEDPSLPTFCDEIDCGRGTCLPNAERCSCDRGYAYEASEQTCVVDACGGTCRSGELCDGTSGVCVAPRCAPDRSVGDFEFCYATWEDGFDVVVRYVGAGTLDLDQSEVRLNGAPVNVIDRFDSSRQTFVLRHQGLEPSKYSYLFRLRRDGGSRLEPLFLPVWIGSGIRFADFTWNDSIVYQIFTDRFHNGDPSNDLNNNAGTLGQVSDVRSQWQGGDFAGITAKIKDGYFERMGVNTLWISSPILNSHNSQPGVDPNDTTRYGSYHSYHPIATGHTDVDDYGYPNPIEPAFGTPEELHELVREAHRRGIRIMPDFVPNHVQREANIYARNPHWFFEHNPCHNRWDEARIGCWFTYDMPDFDYGRNPAAVTAVVEHAIWLIQEFNFDAFRLDALKHMDDVFVRALKQAVVERIETTVENPSKTVEPTIFYMVGESLGGWARYHVRPDMVQGQVDEMYYEHARDALLTFSRSMRDLANFSVPNDTAYLRSEATMGEWGGYPGAIMGNFFGNHDQPRALTEALCGTSGRPDPFDSRCNGPENPDAYARLRLAQTFLMTSPYNVPMLYQGDDIGTRGGADPDNRAMQRFTDLSAEEQASLENVQKAGRLREQYAPLRRGLRSHVVVEDWFWVYRVSYAGEDVYVALNRDDDKQWAPPAGYVDGLGNCANGLVPSMTSCIFVRP